MNTVPSKPANVHVTEINHRLTVRWDPDSQRVVIETVDRARISIHVDASLALWLADRLQDAVDVAEGHCEPPCAPPEGGVSS